jgi:hypothetical protein
MKVYELNRPLFELPPTHPARKFLDAFIGCRTICVGRELPSADGTPIEQEWISRIDGNEWRFSKFAYTFLSFDIQLDGWLTGAPKRTESEIEMLRALPMMRALIAECRSAAEETRNDTIMPLVDQVHILLQLWEECILSRIAD